MRCGAQIARASVMPSCSAITAASRHSGIVAAEQAFIGARNGFADEVPDVYDRR